jgi:sugar O-acyltransferase (sialic acid O-acetyltransferase NeuD family)
MRQAVVIGTGGHSRVVIAILMTLKSHQINQIIELGEPRPAEFIMGKLVTPNYINFNDFCGRGDVDFFLALGDINLRKIWWDKLMSLKLLMPNLISPHAIIDETVLLGEGNVICPRVYIGPLVEIGNNNLINTGAIIEHEVKVGDYCNLAPASLVAGRCKISNFCYVGAGATIIDNISISSGTVIGAGATLISNIDNPDTVVVGVPARERQVLK